MLWKMRRKQDESEAVTVRLKNEAELDANETGLPASPASTLFCDGQAVVFSEDPRICVLKALRGVLMVPRGFLRPGRLACVLGRSRAVCGALPVCLPSWLNPLRFLCQLILTESEFSNLLKFSLWKFHFCRGCFYFFCRYERSPERYPFRAFDTGKIETEIFPYRAADCRRIRRPKRPSETDAFFESGMPGFNCRMGHPQPR